MSLNNESGSSMSFEELVNLNGEAMAVLDEVPYQPVVYAIPEEWRLAEKELLEQAVQFQPTLYRMMQTLATRQELEQLQTALAQILRQEKQEALRSVQTILEQAGKENDKHFSEWSKAQSELKEIISTAEKKITKMIVAGISASASVLVLCLALLRLGM